jgi:hypothetical protein
VTSTAQGAEAGPEKSAEGATGDPSQSFGASGRVDASGAQGVQVGDRTLQVNVFHTSTQERAGRGWGRGRPRPWRVFLSHTGELSRYPTNGAFVAAAERAVKRARHAPVGMDTWTAADSPSVALDIEKLTACDVYVGLIGFRYGSPVREAPSRSYTEHEFDTAGELGMPRLVFLLAEDLDVAVPREVTHEPDHGYSDRQDAFRARVDESGLTRSLVRSPKDLETALYQALVELAERIDRGQAETELVGAGSSEGPRTPVFAIPPTEPGDVPRRDLARQLLEQLGIADHDAATAFDQPDAALAPAASATAEPRVGPVMGMTTGLVGAGGFGKTTLARMLVHDRSVRERFPDGIVWVTLGDQLAGADLADRIDDACATLTGTKPPHTDLILAGAALGQALADRRMLLVLDDAWAAAQVRPLLIGGPHTIRLVTTRQPSVLPEDAVRVDVDAMTGDEAIGLLTAGLPNVPRPLVEELVELTGRWPLLLGLVNRAARDDVRHGAIPALALADVRDQLTSGGVTALDVQDDTDRHRAVSATLQVSLNRLSAIDQDRYRELAVFGEDVEVPLTVLTRYWQHTGVYTAAQTKTLCRRLGRVP